MWVVSAVYDCAPSLSPALRSLHGRPGCSGSIDLPTSCPSLSPLSISADDEAYALDHGYASSTSPSTSLRPKGPRCAPRRLFAGFSPSFKKTGQFRRANPTIFALFCLRHRSAIGSVAHDRCDDRHDGETRCHERATAISTTAAAIAAVGSLSQLACLMLCQSHALVPLDNT